MGLALVGIVFYAVNASVGSQLLELLSYFFFFGSVLIPL
jgi:hypothetical protein